MPYAREVSIEHSLNELPHSPDPAPDEAPTLAADSAAVQALEARLAALEAFVSFAEAAGSHTDGQTLAQGALEVFRSFFQGCSAAFYERQGERWRARVWTDNLEPALVEIISAGLPLDTPVFMQALSSQQATFVDGWDPQREGVAHSEGYDTVAVYPLLTLGEVSGMLALGLRDHPHWSERDRGVVRAVGRSLNLALERAAVTLRLEQERQELSVRTQALEGFVALVGDLSLHSDPLALIARAQQIVMNLLPPGTALYYELENETWWVRQQHGDLRSPDLQAALDAGLPYASTGNLVQPWTTREPFYQDAYDIDTDQLPALVAHIGATACLPLLVEGQPIGVLAVALFGERYWTPTERAVLETIVRSLGLVIEGGRGVRRLAEQTRELERSNRELEQFAYVASHDLKEPLRSIVGFSQLLHRRYSGQLDDRADQYLTLLQESSVRMQQLISDLLSFSRVATVARQVQACSAAEAVARVQRDLQLPLEEAGGTLEWEALPRVQVDPTQLGQIFQNLIGNALKFRSPERPLEIRVSALEQDGWVRFAVQDNGIGIEKDYFERIFLIFQRLHTREQYPGSGIGLALARKIVEGYGGKLWLESELGVGSTFYFTLPRVAGASASSPQTRA